MKKRMTFSVSKADAQLIDKIARRAEVTLPVEKFGTMMDLTAVHANGTPLRLQELLDAPIVHFSHDVMGIHQNLNRETGRLQNFFRPRFASDNVTDRVA